MNMTRMARFPTLALAALGIALAGCAGKQSADHAAVEIRGSAPASGAPAPAPGAPAPAAVPGAPALGVPDATGIVSYDGYQAAVARDGDTVASIAGRIGLSATELASYNGLSADYALRAGDELVLPARPGGYGTAPAPASQPGYQVAQGSPDLYGTAAGGAAIEAAPLDGSAAPDAGTAPADASAAGWTPDLAAAAIERSTSFDKQGNLAQPPSAGEPLPPAPTRPGELSSPNLRQYQTPGGAPSPEPKPIETFSTPAEQPVEVEPEPVPEPQVAIATPEPAPAPAPAPEPTPVAAPAPSGELRLIRPVTGPVVIGFNQGAGRAKNDGIDFASPAGSPVVAATDGEVALVSQSLGGLGTIVLLRHQGEYLTVYGRIESVTVKKGDLVQRGQKIGTVAQSTEPRMHFEVRKGAESLDPEAFF